MRFARLAALAALVLSFVAALLAEAQQAEKVYRIGLLRGDGPVSTWRRAYPALLQGLHELGYVEGSNIVFEVRSAEGRYERLPALATELVERKVDVFYASGDDKILAVKQATNAIPIVMVACDAVEAGLITSLAHPGGNLTGITCISGDLAVKRLELLKEAAGKVSRLAILYDPGDPHANHEVRHVQTQGNLWGVTVQPLEVRDPNDLANRFAAMTRERADGLFVVGSNFTWSHAQRIADLAAANRLPATYAFREFPNRGGLMSYGPNFGDMERRAATYIARILKGAKPADLPVEHRPSSSSSST